MKTDTIVRKEGMQILVNQLGDVDAERFIALIAREPFDYTECRRTNLPDEDVRDLSRKAQEYAQRMR